MFNGMRNKNLKNTAVIGCVCIFALSLLIIWQLLHLKLNKIIQNISSLEGKEIEPLCTALLQDILYIFLFALAAMTGFLYLFLTYRFRALKNIVSHAKQHFPSEMLVCKDEIKTVEVYFNFLTQNIQNAQMQQLQAETKHAEIEKHLLQQKNQEKHDHIEQKSTLQKIDIYMDSLSPLITTTALTIAEIANTLQKIQQTMQQSIENLQSSEQKARIIKNENEKHISYIKSFFEKIAHAHNTIESINSLTNQLTIVAFNAELEAVKESGQSKIIAHEIRRRSEDILNAADALKQNTCETREMVDHSMLAVEENIVRSKKHLQQLQEVPTVWTHTATSAEVSSATLKQISEDLRFQANAIQNIQLLLQQVIKELTK